MMSMLKTPFEPCTREKNVYNFTLKSYILNAYFLFFNIKSKKQLKDNTIIYCII